MECWGALGVGGDRLTPLYGTQCQAAARPSTVVFKWARGLMEEVRKAGNEACVGLNVAPRTGKSVLGEISLCLPSPKLRMLSPSILYDGRVGSLCNPRDSQESSPTPTVQKHQFFGTQLSL